MNLLPSTTCLFVRSLCLLDACHNRNQELRSQPQRFSEVKSGLWMCFRVGNPPACDKGLPDTKRVRKESVFGTSGPGEPKSPKRVHPEVRKESKNAASHSFGTPGCTLLGLWGYPWREGDSFGFGTQKAWEAPTYKNGETEEEPYTVGRQTWQTLQTAEKTLGVLPFGALPLRLFASKECRLVPHNFWLWRVPCCTR